MIFSGKYSTRVVSHCHDKGYYLVNPVHPCSGITMKTKPVIVQLPISTYGDVLNVVEKTMELPETYQPEIGSFFVDRVLPGRLSVHWWGYDARDQKTYLCLSVGYSDATRTLEEWLAANSGWSVAKDPLVVLAPNNPDSDKS